MRRGNERGIYFLRNQSLNVIENKHNGFQYARMLLKINEIPWFAKMYMKTQEITSWKDPIPGSYRKQMHLPSFARMFMKIEELARLQIPIRRAAIRPISACH